MPYFDPPTLALGPLTLHAFGLILAASVLVGLELGRRRFARLGVNDSIGERVAWYVVAGGFLGAHLFALAFYFPEQLRTDPLATLRVWEHLSSFGGIVGGLLAVWLYFRTAGRSLAARARWVVLDVVVFVFAVSLMIGRLGCAVAHDHPGEITTFPLAISLQDPNAQAYITNVYAAAGRASELPPLDQLATRGFHDLGWYEFLYLALVLVPILWLVDRRPQPPGTFVLLFAVMYLPVRFALDFLRVSDATYGGLTPAQWAAIVLLAVVVPLAWAQRSKAAS